MLLFEYVKIRATVLVVLLILIVWARVGMAYCMWLFERKKSNKIAFLVGVHIPLVLASFILLFLMLEPFSE